MIDLHQCDSIEWLRYRCGVTLAPRGSAAAIGVRADGCGPGRVADPAGAAGQRGSAASRFGATSAGVAEWCDSRGSRRIQRRQLEVPPPAPQSDAAEAFVLCDPPYVISKRSTGRIYAHELTDADQLRLLEGLTRLPAAEHSVLLCGYESPLYASLEPWRRNRHRVPTREGLQDKMIWLNYPEPKLLHDHRYVGRTRRDRERFRRQKTVATMLAAMDPREWAAMLETIRSMECYPT